MVSRSGAVLATVIVPSKRATSADIASQLFAAQTDLRGRVASAIIARYAPPLYQTASSRVGTVIIRVIGGVRTGTGDELYVAVTQAAWTGPAGEAVVASGVGPFPARVRLDGPEGAASVGTIDQPREGAAQESDLRRLFPSWARNYDLGARDPSAKLGSDIANAWLLTFSGAETAVY